MKLIVVFRLMGYFALLLPVGEARATTEIWVSGSGSDDAAGTQERPFETLERAMNAVHELARLGLQDAVSVFMRGGEYRLDRTLEINRDNIGDGHFAITIMANPGERVILSGSRKLRGEWQRVRDNLWVLSVPEARDRKWVFRSLFRDGESLPRAREPKVGFYTIASVEDSRRRLRLQQRLPHEWCNLTGVEVNSIAHWHFSRQPVAQITEDSVVGERPIGTDVSSSVITNQSHSRVWLENALVFADKAGDWFLDTGKGELYYVAAAGEDPNRGTFSAPIMRELLVVRGSTEGVVRNVHFRGLEFAETDWEMPADGRLGVQAGAWAFNLGRTYTPDAALRFIYSWNTSVQECTFCNLGDGAISFEIGTRDAMVSHCDFRHVGSNVIQVGRMPEFVGDQHPLQRDFASAGAWSDQQNHLPSDEEIWRHRNKTVPEAPAQIMIADNRVIDCGNLDYGSIGICVTYANHVTIEHNLIIGLPFTAISIGARWAPGLTNCHSNMIVHNRIERVMEQAGDGGGIYLVGEQPGTRVLDNFIRGVYGNYGGQGIYPDECSDHMEIAGNYITKIMDYPIFMHKNGPDQLLHDNNGELGTTAISGENTHGCRWVKFAPERMPPDVGAYGPRGPGTLKISGI